MNESKETMCASCEHFEVCKLKETYLEVVESINDAYISKPEEDGRPHIHHIRNIDFIEIRDPVCKHYMRVVPTIRKIEKEG